jgi:peptidoglycan/LPS O-acetylase OafA/YrhL
LESLPFPPFRDIWWFLLYLQNLPVTFSNGVFAPGLPGHYWSLAVEEHFYLVWPLLVLLMPLRRLFWMSGLLILTAVVARWVFVCKLGLNPFYFTLCRVDALACGTLLACIEAEGKLFQLRRLFEITLLALLPTLAVVWIRFSDQGAGWLQVIKFTFVGGFYWALIGLIVCCQDRKWVHFLFANSPLRFCGKVGYGLYIYHILTIKLVDTWLPAGKYGIVFLAVVLLLVLLISWLSFQFIESPFLKLKKFFSYDQPAKQVASSVTMEPISNLR